MIPCAHRLWGLSMARPPKIASHPGPGVSSMTSPIRMRNEPAVMLKIFQARLIFG